MIKTPNEDELAMEFATQVWGPTAQVDMMIEECSEVIQALLKHRRNIGTGYTEQARDNVFEELADLEIMLSQMKYIFSREKIEEYKGLKMDRLKTRLKKYGFQQEKDPTEKYSE